MHQARRPHVSSFQDPDRFSTRAYPIVDDHPVLATIDEQHSRLETAEHIAPSVLTDISGAIELLVLLGWPADIAQSGVEQICDALIRTGARSSAFEVLGRDKQVRVLLDIPITSWMVLLRAMLGYPEPMYAATNVGRGVLMRLIIGETVPLLLADDDLVAALSESAPRVQG